MKGITIWLTGISSAGKTTIARRLFDELKGRGISVELLDGDEVRKALGHNLGFTKADRDEHVRRIGFIAGLLTRNNVVTIVAAISPYREVREEIRLKIKNFLEVFVNAPLAVCEARDVKGLYKRARAGEITNFTGIDDPYEVPLDPDIECRTDRESVEESVGKILARLAM